MHKPQILSSLPPLSARSGTTTLQATPEPAEIRIFDACHLGVVLRAVLGMELMLALGAIYTTRHSLDWLLQTAWLTSGGLPATLIWILLMCSLQAPLHRMRPAWQWTIGMTLGGIGGIIAAALLYLAAPLAPPHWLASALTGAVLAAVLVGYLILRAQGRTPAATSAQLAMLQASIRPHFLFNTLNSAVALVRDEPQKAERLLEDLSDLFRAALQDPRTIISLREEIDLAQRYLDIEQIRFGDRLQVLWNIDPEALDVGLPPLLLQPLVENAVKHGVEPSEIGAKVTITAQRLVNGLVLLRVTNTLVPPCNSGDSSLRHKGQGMALANVAHRLRLLHDVHAQFSAAPKDGVFEVRICLPIE